MKKDTMTKALRYLSIVIILKAVSSCDVSNDPVANILVDYKLREGHCPLLSTSSGAPVEYRDVHNSLHSNLLRNEFFLESMNHFNRERLPFRLVHALGHGQSGYFEVTRNITHICKAKLFSAVGKKTSLSFRFSIATLQRGVSDVSRDIRGLAVKFYTEEGNWDLVALSTPAFSMKDSSFFPAFIHALKPNPKNNVVDPNTKWDFYTLRPESATFVLNLFSDRGTPAGFIYTPGFSIHTYQVENENGDIHFARFHILPDAGIKTLTEDEVERISGKDPDYSARQLYNSIEKGIYPSWTLAWQLLTPEEAKKAKFDPFDMTKYLPEDEYPVVPIGRIVLNKNPTNFFEHTEQLAFSPGNLVPGILGAPDKMFEHRIISYRDTQLYRLGVNFNKIPVNSPLKEPRTYNRDGRAPVKDNEKDAPNYFPNSFNGPVPYVDEKRSKLIDLIEDQEDYAGVIKQAREYYLYYLTEVERRTLPGNVVSSLGQTVRSIQERALMLFSSIDHDLGCRIARGLKGNATTRPL